MAGGFSANERKDLGRALAEGEDLHCPGCGTRLTRQPVTPPSSVSYVRHRVWLLCPSCKRTGAVDVRNAPGSGGDAAVD